MIQSLKVKTVYFFLLILPMVSEIQGFCNQFNNKRLCYFSNPCIEFKAGYFFFTNSKMRTIYDHGGMDLQLCTTYPLFNLNCNWTINAYGSLEYLYLSGKSNNEHEKTSLWQVPINLGIKPVYEINSKLQYYFALGPRYFYIHQHNDSSSVFKNKSKNGLGFFINTGFNYLLCNNWVIDIFGEYSFAKVHFHSNDNVYTRNIQIGGFTFGGGIGYSF